MFRSINEECGVFGIATKKESDDPVRSAYFALYSLQHRGQESCGIAVNDKGVISYYRDLGLVPDIFSEERLQKLGVGKMAIGHVRYSTKDLLNRTNSQPLCIKHIKGPLAVSHNGNITNAAELRKKFELDGGIFHGTTDTEVIAYTITSNRLVCDSIEDAVDKAMDTIKGAYGMVIMSAQKLIAARDPNGLKPLCMGKRDDGAIVFASESCAFPCIGAEFVRDVRPGEIITVENGKISSNTRHCTKKGTLCIFEHVYFARPDSVMDGSSVYSARLRAGSFLALEHPVNADVVIGVPDSGLTAALGYAQQSGIPYGVGFIKNRYIGRSFIQPTQSMRENAVRIKLSVIESIVRGKRVIMIDDSIVRGTTSGHIVKLLRDAGAKEVHMRVSSPPFISPCYFGTDIDSKDKLIACKMSTDEIAKHIDVDSLGFLSINSVRQIAESSNIGFCDGCFTEVYPEEIPKSEEQDKFERKLK